MNLIEMLRYALGREANPEPQAQREPEPEPEPKPNPVYCTLCGKPLQTKRQPSKYDAYTGEAVEISVSLRCPWFDSEEAEDLYYWDRIHSGHFYDHWTEEPQPNEPKGE